VIALGWVINIFQRGMASMGRIQVLLEAKPDIADDAVAPDLAKASSVKGNLEFRHLSFSYNGIQVLKDINLTIPAGTSLAVVGPTGSGKTTLVSLIPRIFAYANKPPDSSGNGAGTHVSSNGELLLDGRPVREYPLAGLRHNIGFVPQETFLFSTT